jgi:Ran GTPase-activating protein (RanGAP) involved in mRNA processing and transport
MTIDYYGEDGWEELGAVIGRNTHLTKIILQSRMSYIPAVYFRKFARGLAFNRSIQNLSIAGWDHSDREAWDHLTRFFIDNEALELLELELRGFVGRSDEMVSALRRFYSLKEVKLSHHSPKNNGVCVDDIIEDLIEHHTGLKKLTIQGFRMGRVGCAALATSTLTELYLQYGVQINEDGARAFATGLARNTTLKVVSIIVARNISEIAWQSIFSAFSTCKVESLILNSNELNDATMLTLSNALLHNSTLKSLNLCSNRAITSAGWVALSTSLRGIMIEKLHMSDNSIGDIGINALTSALENNSSLRELSLSVLGDIGVTAISTILRHPNSMLEKIDISMNLGRNSISDIGINALTNALVNNRMLKELSIDENPYVTPAGWANFSNVLRNPTSALDLLKVWGGSINDEVMHSFADALANNNKLKELNIGSIALRRNITSAGYLPMTNILCNTSSIIGTFNSNHTLEKLCSKSYESSLPNDLLSVLKINEENSVSKAARLKIIKTHFSGSEINMLPFMVMNLSVRPHALAWMAKDMHMYELLRATPSLLGQIEI